MFYLELRDGEKIFTGAEEDDHAVFRRIKEDKLDKDAFTLFEKLFEFTDEKPGDILERLGIYERNLWEIWDLLNYLTEEDYTDQELLGNINEIVASAL